MVVNLRWARPGVDESHHSATGTARIDGRVDHDLGGSSILNKNNPAGFPAGFRS